MRSPPGVHVGPIHSAVAGRTDHLPMHVHSGSYVLPADIVSAMGEGNTSAGFQVAKDMFGQRFYGSTPPGGGMPYGVTAPHKASGGSVPIVAAGGEFVVHPLDVVEIGKGSLDDGHRVLDAFVKKMRSSTIRTLSGLPGPKKD